MQIWEKNIKGKAVVFQVRLGVDKESISKEEVERFGIAHISYLG